jgi:hypothetical protein
MNPVTAITSAINSVANLGTEVVRGMNAIFLARMNVKMQERAYYVQRLQQAAGYNLPGSPANTAPATDTQGGGGMEKYFLYAAIGVLLLLLIFKKR